MADAILPPLRLGADDADVPLALVSPDDRPAAAAIAAAPTLVQPLAVRRVRAPIATFERLLDDLPATARMVERLGLGRYRIERCDDGTISIDDGYGAHARVSRLVERPGIRVFRARGGFDIFALPTLHGTGIVTLRYEPDPDAPGGPGAALRTGGQIYFRLESRLLHRLARPLVRLLHRLIDRKVDALISAAIAACEHEAGSREPAM